MNYEIAAFPTVTRNDIFYMRLPRSLRSLAMTRKESCLVKMLLHYFKIIS